MWGLVDCDNFFVSCERVFRPDLDGRPVVVLSNNDGCVVALSKECKKMGMKLGLPYFQMLEQFPGKDIIAFSSNYRLYADMSARVMAVLRDSSPAFYQYSIDEAFLDLTGINEAELKAWGETITKKVYQWTHMPVSIGIAPTKTLAKLAAKFAKKYPGYKKCCVISDNLQRCRALQLTEVGDVWGIGRRISKQLFYYGIRTAYDFSLQEKSWIRGKFHVTGERTWRELNGESVLGIDELDGNTKKTIVTSRSFPDMLNRIEEIMPHVANYGARCALKLRKQRSVCSQVTLFIQSNFFREDLPQYSSDATYVFSTPVNSTIEIVEAASVLLRRLYRPGIKYKRAGVMVSEISSASAIQPDLFEYDHERSVKNRNVSHASDEINRRMGVDTLILASQQYPAKYADGKSVKFAHAIRRAMLSPDYSTSYHSFVVS